MADCVRLLAHFASQSKHLTIQRSSARRLARVGLAARRFFTWLQLPHFPHAVLATDQQNVRCRCRPGDVGSMVSGSE